MIISTAATEELIGGYWQPLWYRGKWRIYLDDDHCCIAYQHDDFDGADDANDNRFGLVKTLREAKDEIDEIEFNRGCREVWDEGQ